MADTTTITPTDEHGGLPTSTPSDPASSRRRRSSFGELLEPVRGRLVIAIALQALASVAGVVPFIAVAELGRELLAVAPVDSARVWVIGGVAVAALLVRGALFFGAGMLSHFADADFQLATRRRMIAVLGRLPLGWFTERNSGGVKKTLTDDVSTMHHLVAHGALDLTSGIVTPVVSLAYLFWVDWRMALVTLIPLVVGLFFYGRAMSGYSEKIAEFKQAIGRVSHASVEFVEGISVLKTFGQAGRAHQRFVQAAQDFVRFFLGWVNAMMGKSLVAEVALSPVIALFTVLLGGSLFVTLGWLPAVDLLPFALLGLALTTPVFALGQDADKLRSARHAADQALSVLNTEQLPEPDSSGTSPAPDAPAEVTFSNVRFSYDGHTDVLHDVDLVLRPGTVTALVGPSGSGKSTLAKLLPRFWDVTAGGISVGGADVRRIPAHHLYRLVSFVLQDVQLLRTTIRDNIRLAAPDADDDTVHEAARAAQIHDRLLRLPRGYDSVVGEDAHLSGGEAQRVSIARALLADTPVLVLDEATAFADPESEAAIQDALARLAAGRTVLVIAHRLSSIVDVDQIAVLDEGRIVERGRHTELLAVKGVYARLWQAHEHTVQWRPRAESVENGGNR